MEVAGQTSNSTGEREKPLEEKNAKEWRDPAGNVLAVGEFISLMDGNVCLQTPDGLGTVVPFDRLCEEDRALVSGKPDANVAPPVEPEAAVEEPVERIASIPSATDARSVRREKVVIPFDFVSRFDEGDYGRRIGEMLVAKLQKQGEFLVPDAIDIRSVCAAHNVKVTPQTPLAEIQRVLREYFDADIAIWGSCEKVPGHEWEVYDLTIKCADLTAGSKPTMIYEKTDFRTESVSEIPHRYVAEMLDALYGREADGPQGLNAVAERNWRENPNLVEGGDFETGRGGVPHGWESRGGQQREPLGNLVRWTTEAGTPENRVIRFTFAKSVGDGFGVMYYSKPFAIEEGATYRSRYRYRSNGPEVIVFIKCYAEVQGPYQPESYASAEPNPLASPGGVEYHPELGQLRECYRSQQNMKGEKNEWHTHTEDFTPRHTKYSPRWGRVMFYAYVGAGVVEFDDVVIKQIVPASASDERETPRHSQESAVTIEDMEANERRARQDR